MDNTKIINVVYKYAELAGMNDKNACDDLIERLSEMNINDCIDTILVSLGGLLDRGTLTVEQVLSNADLIIALNPEKYHSSEDLINRLQWIKAMNMEYPAMPLTENHKLVLETFDEFNKLIGTRFDSFYTGGLMGYLATNQELERYHGDLDLFINEEQLIDLYSFIEDNEDFEFISNMDHKEPNGHEFKINYKKTPMSIGLFLFSRLPNNEIVIKEYFYPDQDQTKGLVVNENHLALDYAKLVFTDDVKEHNGFTYKTQSLEGIYHAKRNSRPKDKYDARIIESYVDMDIVERLDNERDSNYSEHNKPAVNSVVEELDSIIKTKNYERGFRRGR